MSAPLPVRPELSDPRLIALYGYWEAKRAGRAMPTRADIDPLEMKAWLGHLLLIDVLDEGRFVYRLYGTGFVDSFGHDMTGRSVDELPPEQQERVRADYQAVCASHQPRARLYTAAFEVPHPGPSPRQESQVVTWERLVLPLSDGHFREDGAQVTMLLVGAYPLADLRPSSE